MSATVDKSWAYNRVITVTKKGRTEETTLTGYAAEFLGDQLFNEAKARRDTMFVTHLVGDNNITWDSRQTWSAS